jgi:hypothetical protein
MSTAAPDVDVARAEGDAERLQVPEELIFVVDEVFQIAQE